MLLFNFVNYVFLLLCLFTLIVMYVLFHCVVLCIVGVQMCAVLLRPGDNTIAVNKYIIISRNVRNNLHTPTSQPKTLEFSSTPLLDIHSPILLASHKKHRGFVVYLQNFRQKLCRDVLFPHSCYTSRLSHITPPF